VESARVYHFVQNPETMPLEQFPTRQCRIDVSTYPTSGYDPFALTDGQAFTLPDYQYHLVHLHNAS